MHVDALAAKPRGPGEELSLLIKLDSTKHYKLQESSSVTSNYLFSLSHDVSASYIVRSSATKNAKIGRPSKDEHQDEPASTVENDSRYGLHGIKVATLKCSY